MDERTLESLEYNCGPLIMDALRDPTVIEIMLNPDGAVWIERYGQEQERIGELGLAQGRLILSLVASALETRVDALHPVIEGSFPLDGSRFEGTFPPIVGPGASFSLRKKANRIITLAEYLESGVIGADVPGIIREAILSRKNIVVVGGTSRAKPRLLTRSFMRWTSSAPMTGCLSWKIPLNCNPVPKMRSFS